MSAGRRLVVGLSGATCSGKTTIAKLLKDMFTATKVLHQDDFYYEEDSGKHVMVEEVGHFNWELVSAFNMQNLRQAIEAEKITDIKSASQESKTETLRKIKSLDAKPTLGDLTEAVRGFSTGLLVLDGIVLFNDLGTAEACDLKIFIELDREEMLRRRTTRVYDPPDVPGYAEKIVWPYYEKNLEEVRNEWNDVMFLDGRKSTEELARAIIEKIVEKSP